MTNSLTTTTTALAPPSPVAEWHAYLDLQVRAGQMAWLCMLFAIMRAQVSVNVDILFKSNEFILTVISDAK